MSPTRHSIAPNSATWTYAPPERLVFGLAVAARRLYYSVAADQQIWSVGLAPDGAFMADPRPEIAVPPAAGPTEISKIAFDEQGRMFLAERPAPTGAFDFAQLSREGVGARLALRALPAARRAAAMAAAARRLFHRFPAPAAQRQWRRGDFLSLRQPGPDRPPQLRRLSVGDRRGSARLRRSGAGGAIAPIGALNMCRACRASKAGVSATTTSRRCTPISPITMTISTISRAGPSGRSRDLSHMRIGGKLGRGRMGRKRRRRAAFVRLPARRTQGTAKAAADAQMHAARGLPAAAAFRLRGAPLSAAAVPARRAARTQRPVPADSLSRAQRAGRRKLLQAGHPGDGGLLLLPRRPGFGGAEPFLLPVRAGLFRRQQRQRLLSGTGRQWPMPAGNAQQSRQSPMPARPDAALLRRRLCPDRKYLLPVRSGDSQWDLLPGRRNAGRRPMPADPFHAAWSGLLRRRPDPDDEWPVLRHRQHHDPGDLLPERRQSATARPLSGPDPEYRRLPARLYAHAGQELLPHVACVERRQELRENCAAHASPAAARVATAAGRLLGARAAFHSRPQAFLCLPALGRGMIAKDDATACVRISGPPARPPPPRAPDCSARGPRFINNPNNPAICIRCPPGMIANGDADACVRFGPPPFYGPPGVYGPPPGWIRPRPRFPGFPGRPPPRFPPGGFRPSPLQPGGPAVAPRTF